MAEYISREDAGIVADYAADEHPYDKTSGKPETFSEYNQGWHDACDYIRRTLEALAPVDVEPVRHGRWVYWIEDGVCTCSECGNAELKTGCGRFCGYCGAKMGGRETE